MGTKKNITPAINCDKINDNYSEITVKLARDAIHFISKLTGLNEDCFALALEG